TRHVGHLYNMLETSCVDQERANPDAVPDQSRCHQGVAFRQRAIAPARRLLHLFAGQIPEAPKAFGGGLMTCPPVGDTRNTARPRWLVPSCLKRNSPSMPVKPDALVSTSSEKRCAPWVLMSAATSATAS